MKKQKLHAGSMVAATGRVTITRKRNSRFYLGMDSEVLAVLLALVRSDEANSSLLNIMAGQPFPLHAARLRLRKACNNFVAKLKEENS